MLGAGSGCSYGIYKKGQDLREEMERLILFLKDVGNILNKKT
jgi:hypothetical protein